MPTALVIPETLRFKKITDSLDMSTSSSTASILPPSLSPTAKLGNPHGHSAPTLLRVPGMAVLVSMSVYVHEGMRDGA